MQAVPSTWNLFSLHFPNHNISISTSFKNYLKQYYPCKAFPAASSLTDVSTSPFYLLVATSPWLCPSAYRRIGDVDFLVYFSLQSASVILTKCAIVSTLSEWILDDWMNGQEVILVVSLKALKSIESISLKAMSSHPAGNVCHHWLSRCCHTIWRKQSKSNAVTWAREWETHRLQFYPETTLL